MEDNDGVEDLTTEDKYSYDQGVASTHLTPTYVKGRLAEARSSTRTVDYSYDAYGRANARSFTSGTDDPYIERTGVHADGSQAFIQLELPDNSYKPERMDYAYDTAGRMRWMWFSDGQNTSELFNATTLDAWGRVRSADFGVAQYFGTFADVGRRLPKSAEVQSPAGSRAIEYTAFDAVGREMTRNESLASFSGTQQVTYDALGRIVTSRKKQGTLTTEGWNYTYDALGNLLSLDDQVGTSDVSMTFDLHDRDRICGVGYGTSPTGCNVDYDYAGSITYEPTRTGSNKLAYFNSGDVRSIVNEDGTTAAFAYDAFGELADLTVTSNSTELHSDHNYGAFMTARSRKTSTGPVAYVARRFPGPGLEISRRGPSATWIFQFNDSHGTRFTVDQKGNYVQEVSYTPYGASTSTGATPGQLDFTSEQWNAGEALEDFGLVQLGKRLYDPALGRFLSRDPLLIPRTAATTNPYSFALNDPINLSDPSGMDPDPINGGAIYASNGGSQSSDGSAVAAGLLAGKLTLYCGVKIGSWFTSSFDQAAFNAARDMQMAMIQMTAQFAAGPKPDGLGFHRGLLRAARDTVKGTARLIADPDSANEIIAHPGRIVDGLLKTDAAMLSGDMDAIGYGAGMFAFGEFGGEFGAVDSTAADLMGLEEEEFESLASDERTAEFGGPGAMRRLEYDGAPYHYDSVEGAKNPAPSNPQDTLDESLQYKETSPRRVGIDRDTREFVIFDETKPGVFHGHTRLWRQLGNDQRSFLIKEFEVSKHGKIPSSY